MTSPVPSLPDERERHYCGCCGNEIGRGSTTDPLWCARCKPHIARGAALGPWDRTHLARTGRDCPFQVSPS